MEHMASRVDYRPLTVRIDPEAFRKLRLYVDNCQYEISGLGVVERDGNDFLVTDVFILKQWTYRAFTELSQRAVAEFLLALVEGGRDPEPVKFWWHSHGQMDVFWSEIDDYTARGFGTDYMISAVTNRAGDLRCRVDVGEPLALTLDNVPFDVDPSRTAAPEPGLEERIREEIANQVDILKDPAILGMS